jgi:hypothetical protein
VGQRIAKDGDYFTLTINELKLRDGREFFSTYDPLVYAAVEFVHDKERIAVPMLIGPSALTDKVGKLPHGFLINDIVLAGPHPFRGGRVSITIVLYKARNKDYAKRILQFVEGISAAVGIPANVALLSKVGLSLLDAFETLLEMGDSEPIVGHRIDIDTATTRGFSTGVTALIAGPEDVDDLKVRDGRLLTLAGGPYCRCDYVLYSVGRAHWREQESTLPFYRLTEEIGVAALAGDSHSWKRAKALLITLYQQMIACPDITREEADILFNRYKSLMLRYKEEAADTHILSAARQPKPPPFISDLNRALDEVNSL